MGNVDNISDIYNVIDLLLVTSIHEGIPTVSLEAMFFGVVVIARNVGGLSEVIKHGTNGFLYNDIKDAKMIIKKVYRGKARYEQIRSNCRIYAEEHFGNLLQAKKYLDAYKSICRRR